MTERLTFTVQVTLEVPDDEGADHDAAYVAQQAFLDDLDFPGLFDARIVEGLVAEDGRVAL